MLSKIRLQPKHTHVYLTTCQEGEIDPSVRLSREQIHFVRNSLSFKRSNRSGEQICNELNRCWGAPVFTAGFVIVRPFSLLLPAGLSLNFGT